MQFGSTLIKTLCAEESVLFDSVRIVFVLTMGYLNGEGKVNLINLKCSLHPLHSMFSSSSCTLVFLFISSAVTLAFDSVDQLERAAHILFISSFPLSLLCISVSLLFSDFNLIPHVPSPLLPPPICCFFIFMQVGPRAYSNLPVPH